MNLKSLARWLTPLGFIEFHRRKYRLSRLGLASGAATAAAVEACRYELWPDFLRAGSAPWTLVDVGANEGAFTSAVLSMVRLRRVYAFEPLPGCRPALNAALSRTQDAIFFPLAVGSRAGEVELNVTEDSKMSSVLAPDASIATDYDASSFAVRSHLKVPMTTLDQALPANQIIDLLKIDVQGYELEVLAGAKETLTRTRAVLLEVNYVSHYEGSALFDDVCMRMHDTGFRVSGISAPYAGSRLGPMWADAMFSRSHQGAK